MTKYRTTSNNSYDDDDDNNNNRNNMNNNNSDCSSTQQQQQQQQQAAVQVPQSPIVIPKFAYSELILGKRIGQGGFSEVTIINSIDLDEVYDTDIDQEYSRKNFVKSFYQFNSSNNNTNNSTNTNNYVIKTLRTDLPDDDYRKGIQDLAIEYNILLSLQMNNNSNSSSNNNIIQIQGISISDPNRSQFFIIYNQLYCTLDTKIDVWRSIIKSNHRSSKSSRCIQSLFCNYYCCCISNTKQSILLHNNWKERFYTIQSICTAIQYLHSHNIIYRDLKPDNIGYTTTTTPPSSSGNEQEQQEYNNNTSNVKLFDFGLAKRIDHTVIKSQLDDKYKSTSSSSSTTSVNTHTDLYLLTGNTGSLRYMAPEIALDLPYNYTVDAYSFGILFWQICTLTIPYSNYTMKMHADYIVRDGQRPKIDTSWPIEWISLMELCWSPNYYIRPTFTTIVNTVNSIVEDLEYIDDNIVPTRISMINAKKKRKKLVSNSILLDTDTRILPSSIGTTTTTTTTITPNVKNRNRNKNGTIETVKLSGQDIV